MIEFRVVHGTPAAHECDAIVTGLHEPIEAPRGSAVDLDRVLRGDLLRRLVEESFEPRPGRTALIHMGGRGRPRRVIVAGLGPALDGAAMAEPLRTAAAAAVRRAQEHHLRHLAFAPLPARGETLRALTQARVEGIILGAYRFSKYRQADAGAISSLARVDLLADGEQTEEVTSGMEAGRLFAGATALARDLVNEPPNVLTPSALAERAVEAAQQAGVGATVYGRGDLERFGMHALLAVSAGSAEEPRLVVLDYHPRRARRTVALIGKGLTFDSGGLDLKTAEGMETMKSDMAGAAAVLAAVSAAPRVVRRTRVLGVLAAVENMPGGPAMKPGDIIRAMNGKTIEITNTDAEGRVVLADALAYAAAQGPDELIDIATLTGGARIALGMFAAAILGSDQRLIDALRAAGEQAGERIWQLPLYREYGEVMRSPVADLRNSGGRYGSPEKGAAFLQPFTGGRPWAHLDIAPVAFLEVDEGTGPYLHKHSGTGFGVRTFLHYLRRTDTPRAR